MYSSELARQNIVWDHIILVHIEQKHHYYSYLHATVTVGIFHDKFR